MVFVGDLETRFAVALLQPISTTLEHCHAYQSQKLKVSWNAIKMLCACYSVICAFCACDLCIVCL